MSNARDQFAEDIYTADRLHKNDPPSLVTHYSYVIADELIAAGYRKPWTITTAAERALLQPGTICMDERGAAWKRGTGSWVSTGGDTGPLYDEDDITLTVLHEGDVK